MNTVHDMGGMDGFGPIEREANEPVFHADWERRVYALQRAMGATGLWTIDGGRATLENLPPLEYLAASYYKRWSPISRPATTNSGIGPVARSSRVTACSARANQKT